MSKPISKFELLSVYDFNVLSAKDCFQEIKDNFQQAIEEAKDDKISPPLELSNALRLIHEYSPDPDLSSFRPHNYRLAFKLIRLLKNERLISENPDSLLDPQYLLRILLTYKPSEIIKTILTLSPLKLLTVSCTDSNEMFTAKIIKLLQLSGYLSSIINFTYCLKEWGFQAPLPKRLQQIADQVLKSLSVADVLKVSKLIPESSATFYGKENLLKVGRQLTLDRIREAMESKICNCRVSREDRITAMRMLEEFIIYDFKPLKFKSPLKQDICLELLTAISDEGLLNQGFSNLCGPKAFWRVLLTYKPSLAIASIIRLCQEGETKGCVAMKASPDLMTNENSTSIVTIAMAALKNASNATGYSSQYLERFRGITEPKTLTRWLIQAGFEITAETVRLGAGGWLGKTAIAAAQYTLFSEQHISLKKSDTVNFAIEKIRNGHVLITMRKVDEPATVFGIHIDHWVVIDSIEEMGDQITVNILDASRESCTYTRDAFNHFFSGFIAIKVANLAPAPTVTISI